MTVYKQKLEQTFTQLTYLPYLFFFVLSISILSGCGGSSSSTSDMSVPSQQLQTPNMNAFYFTVAYNPSLSNDIQLQVNADTIIGRIPTNVPVTALIANFTHSGSEVSVNNIIQTSGETVNDFTQIQVYTVKTNDGKSHSFSVDLTKFTGLPIIRLATEGGVDVTSKDDYVNGEVWIDGGRNYVELTTVPMEIRGRGHSTWAQPKKPYQMKLASRSAFLDMPSDKKWLFLAEYSDKTMLRNTIAFEMGHMSSLTWTPQSVFSEVYLNNDYIGTYNVTQKIEESDNRLPLWDFDLSFGNVDYADSRYPEGYWVMEHEWYARLFQDPAFVSQVQARFAFFKENQHIILSKIDEYAMQLHWAQQENDDALNSL